MTLHELDDRLRKLEQELYGSFLQTMNAIATEKKEMVLQEIQSQAMPALTIGICVDTQDPLKQGRIRIYTPLLDGQMITDTKQGTISPPTDAQGLMWAYPISSFGGFDDSGAFWVPPAGSKVAILFQGGNRPTPFYIGTIWDRNRGPDGQHTDWWNYPNMDEFNCLYDGKRNGYLAGDNTGAQVFPPWNTECYNGYDTDSEVDFYDTVGQYGQITFPYIYGMKTPQKHMIKFVDGDQKCNQRWKRLEIMSSCGNWLLMKDDHLHPAGQWAFSKNASPSCHTPGEPFDFVHTAPTEFPCCSPFQEPQGCTNITCASNDFPNDCSIVDGTTDSSVDQSTGFKNPFYKRQEEMRLYEGAKTPMANHCELAQSGIHLQSLSGHQIVFDDEVDQPKGVPTWERDFDFGCNDWFKGKLYARSATGHEIRLDDTESQRKVRGEDNGIFLETANGNSIKMIDDTTPAGSDCTCPENFAGPMRGIWMESTSQHQFVMSDERVHQCSDARMNGGEPKLEDKHGYEGFVLLRSGYGLQLLMKDQDIQTETKEQFIQILSPQTTNTQRGPHMEVMQETADGPGLVFLRAGGVYYRYSYDSAIEVVGTADNPDGADKFVEVPNGSYLVDVKEYYFNHAEEHIFLADKYIFLMAGTDCPVPTNSEDAATKAWDASQAAAGLGQTNTQDAGPCIFPVIVANDPWVCPFTQYIHYGIQGDPTGGSQPILDSRSNRVFASTRPKNAITGDVDHIGPNASNLTTAGGNPGGITGGPPADATTTSPGATETTTPVKDITTTPPTTSIKEITVP